MLISKVSMVNFNGKNLKSKQLKSVAEKAKEASQEYYSFGAPTGQAYLEKPATAAENVAEDKFHSYLYPSMNIKSDVKKAKPEKFISASTIIEK